jgi:hypothetical protein
MHCEIPRVASFAGFCSATPKGSGARHGMRSLDAICLNIYLGEFFDWSETPLFGTSGVPFHKTRLSAAR